MIALSIRRSLAFAALTALLGVAAADTAPRDESAFTNFIASQLSSVGMAHFRVMSITQWDLIKGCGDGDLLGTANRPRKIGDTARRVR
jgi:hypothetical protein